MSKMIDRVARAGYEEMIRRYAEQEAFDAKDDPWEAQDERLHEHWRSAARKMIEAMREPSEAMDEAAKPFRKGVGEGAGRLWTAMIDQALRG